MQIKILAAIILFVSFAGCFNEVKPMAVFISYVNSDDLYLDYNKSVVNAGDEIQINLYTNKDISCAGFILDYDKNIVEIVRIEKNGLPENNLLATEENIKGKSVIIADMKNNLQKGKEFAKIVLKTTIKPDSNIKMGVSKVVVK